MDSHSSTSRVRVVSSSNSNPNYNWVLLEVLEKSTEYLSVQKINKFREEYDFIFESTIIAEPCSSEEFGKMASKRQLSAKDLRLFYDLGQKRDKSASTSQNSQGQGPVNPTPSGTPPPPSPKRQRLEGNSDVPNPNSTNQPVPELNRPPTADRVPEKWWLYFREFESADDINVTSIFDHHFQLTDVIEGNLCKPTDRARIQKVGLRNTATMAQSMAARTTFLAHGLGHGIDVLEKENFDLKQKLKTLGNVENIIKELTQKLSKLEVDVGRVTTLSEEVDAQKSRVKDLETENKTLTDEKTTLSSTISLLKEEKEKV
ncbi:hypothetical protein SESBI_41227 [Sesbania bispinosa]|nr:hypothetical protein SESBI_41227 [Sesbania bispinosa]